MRDTRLPMASVVGRLSIAVGVAFFTGPLAASNLFEKDVRQQIAANYAAENAPLIRAAETRDDSVMAANRSARDQLQQRIVEIDRNIAALRGGADAAGADSPAMKQQSALVARLVDDKAAADDAVTEAQGLVADEQAGIPGAGRSGRPGEGVRYKAAVAKLMHAQERAAAAAKALAEAQDRLRQMQDAAVAAVENLSDENRARLKELLKDRDTAQAEVARLDAAYQSLVAGRPGRIAQALATDPAQVPEAAGLTARLSALWQIGWAHPEVLLMVIALHVVFIGLELMVMLAVSRISGTPTYHRMTAFDEAAADVAMERELAALINNDADGSGDVAQAAAVTTPEPPEDDGPTGAAVALPIPEPEPDAVSALDRYFMRIRADARRREDEEADALAERDSRLAAAGKIVASSAPKRGRGRPPGAKNRPKPDANSGEPVRDDGTGQNEASEGQEKVDELAGN